MEIKLGDTERKMKDFEAKCNSMSATRNKENDYLESLGKSGHTLRMEKLKNKELQNQNDMIQRSLIVMENSYA